MRSKRSVSWVAWSIPFVIIGLLGWANSSLAQEKQEPKKEEPKKVEPPKPPVVEKDVLAAAEEAKLAQFVKLVKHAGLDKMLKDKGPYTIFAPTDEAFNNFGKENLDELMKPEKKMALQKILNCCVVKGKHMAADVKKMKECKTEAGEVPISEKNGTWMFGTAKIVKTDMAASNGVIHTIDRVVMATEKPKEEKPKEEKPAPKPPAGGGGGG